MSYLEKIEEKETEGYCFEVKHKTLQIPKDSYLTALSDYQEPFSEQAAQQLIEEYLDWKDEQGLLGMIRLAEDEKNDLILLDAAIRYITTCD